MNEEDLLEKLRKRRESLGYSQDYFASLLGMTQPNYCNIESGKNRLTYALFRKIKEIKEFEDFDEEDPVLPADLIGSEPADVIRLDEPSEKPKDDLQAEKSEGNAENSLQRKGIASFWPWNENLLYLLGSALILLQLNEASRMWDDIVRGVGNDVPPHGAVTVIIKVLVFLFSVFLWYLFIRLIIWLVKWVRRRKKRVISIYKPL